MMTLIALILLFLSKWFILEFILVKQPWLTGIDFKTSLTHSIKQGLFTFILIMGTINRPYLALGFACIEAVLTLSLNYLNSLNPSPELPVQSLKNLIIPFSEKHRQTQLFKVQYRWKGLTIFLLILFNLFIASFLTFLLTH